MASWDLKDLTRRTAYDKILHDKAFILLKVQNMMDIIVDLLQWFLNFFSGSFINNEISQIKN